MMKIAFLVSEAVPYAKTGGLADVAGALPKYLACSGADVRLFMPLYREVRKKGLPLTKVVDAVRMPLGGRDLRFSLWEHVAEGFRAYFVENDEAFDRDALYGVPSGDYPDNGERFGSFAKASLESMKRLGFAPDILHGHDWQSAAALVLLKHPYAADPFFGGTRSVFSIHNLAYQGVFGPEFMQKAGFKASLFSPMSPFEFWGRVNLMKVGISYADVVSTVSKTYAEEITSTEEYGCGLEGVLRSRKGDLVGILNGIDMDVWDPAKDALIPYRFTPAALAGKGQNRAELLKAFSLPETGAGPVIGMISRLVDQKGFDILAETFEPLMALGVNLVVLGTGQEKYHELYWGFAKKYPKQFGLKLEFNDRLAHLIEAGSDFFLMPSRYEPCGLNQMYSLRYGTIPIVRATGGLDDSIEEFDPMARTGNGFKFGDATPAAMLGSIRKAMDAFRDRSGWESLVRNAMAGDFSWDKAAGEYLKLYAAILGR